MIWRKANDISLFKRIYIRTCLNVDEILQTPAILVVAPLIPAVLPQWTIEKQTEKRQVSK